jgi:hypothetical protein
MIIKKIGSIAVGALMLAACGSVDQMDTDLGTSEEAIIRPTQTGGRNEVVMLYVVTGNGGVRL